MAMVTYPDDVIGTQYGNNQSKPVYHCDVSEGTLTCTDGDSDRRSELWVTCGPMSEGSCMF